MEGISDSINSLIGEIDGLLIEIEDIYTSIYEHLPQIEEEIDLTLDEMNVLLDYFIVSQQADDQGYRITDVLHEISEQFESNRKKMVNKDELKVLTRHFNQQEQGEEIYISTLISSIEDVQDRIEDIELISLNAIIYAAKLGKQGRAFSVIANNIIDLSNGLSKLYQEILLKSKSLKQWNDNFAEDLEELINHNQELKEQQTAEFEKLFTMMFDSLNSVEEILTNMVENIKQALAPIGELMTSIQVQDIIKQNMEFLADVLLDLEEKLADYQSLDEKADRLDRIVFGVNILDLVIDAVESVEDSFVESLYDLNSFLTEIETDLTDFEQEGELIVDLLSGEDSGSTVKEIFARVSNFISDFEDNLSNFKNKTDQLTTSNDQLYDLISDLEVKIEVIEGEMDFLNKLELVSKIELARIDLKNDSFAIELEEIADELTFDIKENKKAVDFLKERLVDDLANFKSLLESNRENINKMGETITSSKDKFNLIEGLVNDAITALGHNSNQLINEVYNLQEKVNAGLEVADLITEVKEVLYQLKSSIKSELKSVDQEMKFAEIDIFDQELIALLTEFERRFHGINKEEKSQAEKEDEGDLVLF